MIKILSFIGSMAGERSGTARYSDQYAVSFKEAAAKNGEEVSYERITGDMVRVEYCRSCCGCFRTGECHLDKKDDMDMLKKKMMDCDILFFGSPVYLGEMSGLAKSVLDRIAYWAHRYELAGKPAAVFATTDGNHGKETAYRMAYLLSYTGLIPVHVGYATRGMYTHPNLNIDEDMKEERKKCARNLLKALKSPIGFIREEDEQKFRTRKRLAKLSLAFSDITGVQPWDEYVVLKERGILEAETYKDFLMMLSKSTK